MAKAKTVALIGSTLSDKVGQLVAVKEVGKAKKALAPLGVERKHPEALCIVAITP